MSELLTNFESEAFFRPIIKLYVYCILYVHESFNISLFISPYERDRFLEIQSHQSANQIDDEFIT